MDVACTQGQIFTVSAPARDHEVRSVDPGGSAANAIQTTAATAGDTRTEKQKALANQAERLFDMATELKVQVDKTNKNILSMKVVQKAEEIESLAKGMKVQARR